MPSYPGLGLPLNYFPQKYNNFYPRGNDELCIGSQSDLLQVREVAMMHIIDRLTDKTDWHKKVFDEEIVAKWRAEALAYPNTELWRIACKDQEDPEDLDEPTSTILSGKTFDYCIQELRCKARYFIETGIVPTLDAIVSIAKSDTLIQPQLVEALRNAFERLMQDQADSPDWHPGTDEQVLDLVHPSMYPLMFKSTPLFEDEVVGVTDAVEKWAGKGAVIFNTKRNIRGHSPAAIGPTFWSGDYQWLPSNVTLHGDGSASFTSYINNLHPAKYPEIYAALEKLVERALPMWDQCLFTMTNFETRENPGRQALRCPLPQDPSDENEENWIPPSYEHLKNAKSQENSSDRARATEEKGEETASEDKGSQDTSNTKLDEEQLRELWEKVRQPVLPEPNPFEEIDYSPPTRLVEKFKDAGLQIIVKMASIELTPEKPSYTGGSWHVEGLMNEHICATAIYYLDSENITTSALSFRMPTDPYLNENERYSVLQNEFNWLELVHGTTLGVGGGACLQNYGSIETGQGRFLAFPNVFQHQVSPFELADPTKPGHRRFIALWLVDPHMRIVSTANVPPQQQDWWVESVLGQSTESQQAALAKLPTELVQLLAEKGLTGKAQLNGMGGILPPELQEMVRAYFESPVMSKEQAKEHRLKLMKERTASTNVATEMWQRNNYNFCEH